MDLSVESYQINKNGSVFGTHFIKSE